MTILDGLKQTVASIPQRCASITPTARYTFRELDERVNRLSNALVSLGLRRGDRVAILSLNNHRYLELYYGVPQLGAVVVPINFRITPAEVKYIIEHSAAVAVCVDDALLPMIDALRPILPAVKQFISIGEAKHAGYLDYEELLAAASPQFSMSNGDDAVTVDDLLGLFYTSGTTAEPKGVMLTHGNMLANIEHSNAVRPAQPDDIYLHTAPMFHLADGAAAFLNVAHGVAQAYIGRFEPSAVFDIIQRERITTMVLIPTMITFLLLHPKLRDYDLSSLRHITYGASPIAPDVLRKAMQAFACDFGQGYGLTEASPLLTVLTAADHKAALEEERLARRLASCGRAVPGVEVRVVKDNGEDVRPGEVGEVIARGANIMKGYWKRPDETAKAVRDGWLYTGDLATVDEEGYVYLVDRKKDMIVSAGENVFSTEVEAVIYKHPAVKEAAVIPVPDKQWGEAVHVCLSLKDGASLRYEELFDFCKEELPTYKVPRSMEIFEGELPKGGTGKILKKELRKRHWQGHERLIG